MGIDIEGLVANTVRNVLGETYTRAQQQQRAASPVRAAPAPSSRPSAPGAVYGAPRDRLIHDVGSLDAQLKQEALSALTERAALVQAAAMQQQQFGGGGGGRQSPSTRFPL